MGEYKYVVIAILGLATFYGLVIATILSEISGIVYELRCLNRKLNYGHSLVNQNYKIIKQLSLLNKQYEVMIKTDRNMLHSMRNIQYYLGVVHRDEVLDFIGDSNGESRQSDQPGQPPQGGSG